MLALRLNKLKTFVVNILRKCCYLPVLGRVVQSGGHPVPANCFLAGDGVWHWHGAAEEDTRHPFNIAP